MRKKISFAEKLEVVLLHGSLSVATDTQIAQVLAVHDVGHDKAVNPNIYCFKNFEEMMIGDGADIVKFSKIKPFIEHIYSQILADNSKHSI